MTGSDALSDRPLDLVAKRRLLDCLSFCSMTRHKMFPEVEIGPKTSPTSNSLSCGCIVEHCEMLAFPTSWQQPEWQQSESG